MSPSAPVRADMVVVGSGPNGLAAALLCARAGRSVVVLEAEDTVGGGCRTLPMDGMPGDLGTELMVDPCSAVHPMAGASPFFLGFDLSAHGVELVTPPVQLAHALPGRDAIVVPSAPGPGSLADGLGSDAEARAWSRLMGPLATRTHDVVAAALSDQRSVPPVAATAALGVAFARAHPRGALGDPLGPDGRTLLSGISAHAITPLSSPAATGVGLVLGSLLHSPRGWALPVGGSGALTAALSDALREAGGEIRTGFRVGSLAQVDARDVVFNTSWSPRPRRRSPGARGRSPTRRSAARPPRSIWCSPARCRGAMRAWPEPAPCTSVGIPRRSRRRSGRSRRVVTRTGRWCSFRNRG